MSSIGEPVPDFTLANQDGKPVSSQDLEGHPVVFALIYSTCRDTCPAQVQTIKGAVEDVENPDVRVIGISVDPANDTAKRAQSFLLKQGSCEQVLDAIAREVESRNARPHVQDLTQGTVA